MSTASATALSRMHVGALTITPFLHPQGCRSYLLTDPASRESLVIDPHLDLVDAIEEGLAESRSTLLHVVDTHTHADHPSGSAALAARFPGSERLAHPASGHAGLSRTLADGEVLRLGSVRLVVRHAPGHTPDHVVLIADGALFCGDTLLIGGVARTDFLGGDAGALFDTLRALLSTLRATRSSSPRTTTRAASTARCPRSARRTRGCACAIAPRSCRR